MIDPRQALQSDPAERRWDAVVIGAGPAGASTALGLARGGLAVLLVDKADWPRAKVCGGCLNGAGLAAIERLGASRALAEAERGPVLRCLRLRAGRRARATLELPPGRAVDRRRFDAALVDDAVAHGVAFMPATPASSTGPGVVTLRQRGAGGSTMPRVVHAELIVAAAGLDASSAGVESRAVGSSRIGVGAIVDAESVDEAGLAWLDPGSIHMACGRAGYVGLTRLSGDRIDVAAAFQPGAIRAAGDVAAAVAAVLHEAQLGEHRGSDARNPWRSVRFQGTRELTRRPERPWGPRVLAVGDAAGYIEPFTGEGMAWAIAGGAALSDHVLAHGGRWNDAVGPAWTADHRRLVARRHARCRLITALLRRPTLSRWTIRAVGMVPGLAHPFVHAINRPITAPQGPVPASPAKG